jgi:hypothetical protein
MAPPRQLKRSMIFFKIKKGALPYIDRARLIHPIISSFTAALGQAVDYVANIGEKVDGPLV